MIKNILGVVGCLGLTGWLVLDIHDNRLAKRKKQSEIWTEASNAGDSGDKQS